MKKYIAVIGLSICAMAFILSLPEKMISSVPTARNVTVQKVEHTDKITVDGSLVVSSLNGEACVYASVSEKDISKISLEQKAEITGVGFPDKSYSASITHISDTAVTKKVGSSYGAYVDIKMEIDEPDEDLRSGYTATATILTAKPKTMDILPYEVVSQDDYGEFVYTLVENTAKKCYVETGMELSNGVEILSGLPTNAVVISIDENEFSEDEKIILE